MKMKKKLFIPLIAALLTIGLTSVGFAAWVIVGSTTAEIKDKNFQVYSVEDDRFVFAAATSTENIVWGMDSTPADWLTVKNETDGTAHGEESLDIVITLTPSGTNYYNKTVTYTLTPAITAGESVWTTAKNSGFVADLPAAQTLTVKYGADGNVTEVSGASGGATAEKSGKVVTVTMSFDWGALTGGENPMKFFNSKDSAATAWPTGTSYSYTTYGDAAKAMLDGIATLKTVTYAVTVVGSINQ